MIHRLLLAALVALATFPALAEFPATRTEPVKEMLHGIELVDPYRWLEGSAAPEIGDPRPELDTRVAEWTATQNQYTRSVLDGLPGRESLAARLAELLEGGSVGLPVARGKYTFYTERRGNQAQDVLYVRERGGETRSLLDPNALDGEGLTTLAWFEPSPDGELVAFGLFQGGDENSTLHVLRTTSGEWLAEEIPGKVRSVGWMPGGDSFVYRRLRELDDPYSAQVKIHRLGTHHRQDPLVIEQERKGPLSTTWGPSPVPGDNDRWLGLVYHTSTRSNDLWVYDLARWRQTGEWKRIDLSIGESAQNLGSIRGNTFFLRTTQDAPNGRVIAIDLERPQISAWRILVPEDPEAVIESITTSRDQLLVTYLSRASTRIERFDLDGKPLGALSLPDIGSARISTRPDQQDAFVSFESYNHPPSIFRFDLTSGNRELWARTDIPVEPGRFQVSQVSYPSKDGTSVTMFLVHRNDLEPDGETPTILFGYGGFKVPVTPNFSARLYPWFEAGGIFAVANLRGGGEYGEQWHRAGMLEQKQNVFDDFIAAAEYLIGEGYTSPEHLGIYGGSNGGLLTGAVVVQRPDLFSAAISAVPLLDMLRYQHFLMARYWIPEYGSAENPDQLEFLLRYSPYQNVRKGTAYPAILLTAGENDSRVHPLHARKMAARLQAATASDPEAEPILLRVEGEAGHGQGTPLATRLRNGTDFLAFMGWQLGLQVE